ncbi:MAG TPA: GH25 family lysozyme [Bryobacteraceae bacterium]
MPVAQEVLGIDVSHHNGTIEWPVVARQGIAFAYAKATEGATFTDPKFKANWDAIRGAGMLRGAYHFFHPALPIADQADRFIAATGTLAPGDLPPMLDLEETSPDPNKNEWPRIAKAQRVPLAIEWLERVEQALGRRPLVYTRRGFMQDWLGDPGPLVHYPVWIAHYTQAPQPMVPAGWDRWTFWQYTETGRLDGLDCQFDFNRFQGSLPELLALAGIDTSTDAATAS